MTRRKAQGSRLEAPGRRRRASPSKLRVELRVESLKVSDTVRPAARSLLAKAKDEGRARLRVYIGAAAGVGKSYQMLEDAHQLKRQGLDVVIGLVETHGRAET